METLTMTASEAAKRLGISPGTFRKIAQKGEISGKKVCRSIRYTAQDIDDYLRRSVVTRRGRQ